MTRRDLLQTERRLRAHILWVNVGANLLIGVLTAVVLALPRLA